MTEMLLEEAIGIAIALIGAALVANELRKNETIDKNTHYD